VVVRRDQRSRIGWSRSCVGCERRSCASVGRCWRGIGSCRKLDVCSSRWLLEVES
jgi:hypothetical protein